MRTQLVQLARLQIQGLSNAESPCRPSGLLSKGLPQRVPLYWPCTHAPWIATSECIEERVATSLPLCCLWSAEGESSAWDAWVKPLLVKAFSQAPLDFGGIWAVSLRYMLYHLSKCSIDGFNEILRIVLRPVSIGKCYQSSIPCKKSCRAYNANHREQVWIAVSSKRML